MLIPLIVAWALFMENLDSTVLATSLPAMMVPVGRLVLLRSVAKSEMVTAMAWLTVPALIGPVIGPLLGGFVTTYFHWRWIFWNNVPIALLGLVLATLFIPTGPEPRPPAFDVRGFLLVAMGLVGLMFGFETIGRDIVPGWASGLLLVAGAACVLPFVRHATRIAHPVLDLGLLRVPTFRASILGGFLFRVGIGALPFLLPLLLQAGCGLDPCRSGQLTFAAAVGALTMKLAAKPILRRFGLRHVLPRQCRPQRAVAGGHRPVAVIDQQRLSRATSFASMTRQLALSAEVATGAIILHATMGARGGGVLAAADFGPAFLAVRVCATLSGLAYLRLPGDAGAEVSGHVPTAQER